MLLNHEDKSDTNLGNAFGEAIEANLGKALGLIMNGTSGRPCGDGGSVAPRENPLHGLKTEIEWQMVWFQAIAAAWASWDDPTGFKAQLVENPERALDARFGFKMPPLMTLVILDVVGHEKKGLGWHPSEPDMPSHWCLPNSILVMPLPPPPAETQQALGLGNYTATGRSYPFTCCC